MEQAIPNELSNKSNEIILKYLHDASAHSDVAEALAVAVAPLGDVQMFCPDPAEYKYIVAATKNIIFGLAIGMNQIAFRLGPVFKDRALETGGKELLEVGSEWVAFKLFRNDWPEIDLSFWARKAYVFASGVDAFQK